jgi:hypothetical protein
MDVYSRLTFGSTVRSGGACLLAWLILVLGAPDPAVVLAGVGSPMAFGCEDSAPEDTPPTENETPQDENILPEFALRRSHVLGRANAFSSIVRSTPVVRLSPRLQACRPSSGHFLADGRSLRHWLRSLTC